MILNTLVYDGKVERTLSGDGNTLYRAVEPLLNPPGLIKSTCGVCPVSYFIYVFIYYLLDDILLYINNKIFKNRSEKIAVMLAMLHLQNANILQNG